MNIFNRILNGEHEADTRLGCPSRDEAHFERRVNALWHMTKGKGFRATPKGPKLSRGGKTRVQREAHLKEIYWRNLAREQAFREEVRGQRGWSSRAINRAIEQRVHLTD